MSLETVTSCPICNGTSFKPFQTCTDFTTSKEQFSIVTCTSCDLCITSPRPDPTSIGKYYESDSYISHTNSSQSLTDKIYKVVRSFALNWKLKLVTAKKDRGAILDYGCGTGEFLATCKEAKWACYGVEPSAPARTKALSLSDSSIVAKLSDLNSKKFDVITLWHVLEHIGDLNEKLSELKNLLAKDGIIFIAVPNRESRDAKIYKSFWAGYDVPRHLWHFSPENITKLFNAHQLDLIETIPMKQDSFYVSLLSEKYLHPNRHMLVNLILALLTGLRSNLAATKTKNYSSLIYIAKA